MSQNNPLARLEAYSDGIFAIAATLLVLEIKVPAVTPDAPLSELWSRLGDLWPSYLAFVISFGSTLVMWVNHHNALRMLHRSSKTFLYANGLLLLTVTFIPFPTALLARYIDTKFAAVAAMFYAGYALVTNAAFLAWVAAMHRPVHLLKPGVSHRHFANLRAKTQAGTVVYLITALVSWRFPVIGLVLISALWVLWAMMSIGDTSEP